MVNADFTHGAVTPAAGRAEAERRVVLSYVPVSKRAGIAALLSLDDVMADITRTTSEPMIGQMRFTWWHGALASLDEAPPPAQPVLRDLATHVLPSVTGASLGRIVEGWEELLEPGALDDAALKAFAQGRGGGLFEAMAAVIGGPEGAPVAEAGGGWALSDLALHTADERLAERARILAEPMLARAAATLWPRSLRALGALAHLARRPQAGAGARVARMLFHRLTGL